MFALLATLTLTAQVAVQYADSASWLCRPGRVDTCAVDLSTTVIAADGSMVPEKWTAAPNPAVDCFYVYPTVSRDTSDNSDLVAGDEERDVIRQQFARFASVCKPYAPLYRQVTLRGLQKRMAGSGIELNRGTGYDDVVAAWKHYLANDNRGRGVILIGHSQGAMILDELIRREIDGKPAQRFIVSAILAGANILVPPGRDVGGSFQSMPLCKSATQTGCLITFATFRGTVPPAPNAFFGRSSVQGMQVACTNPAALAGGRAALHAYFVSGGLHIAGSSAAHNWTRPGTRIPTPFVSVPGLVSAECIVDERGTRLSVNIHPDSTDPRADDITGDLGAAGSATRAQWGLHLIDMNLVMGDLLGVVAKQIAQYKRP